MNGSTSPHRPTEELAAYLGRRLSPADRAVVEAHVAGCRECRQHLAGATRLLRQRFRVRRVGTAAVVGSVVLVGALLMRTKPAHDVRPDSIRRGAPDTPIDRRAVLSVITPLDGDLLVKDSAWFVWHSGGEGMRYNLTVTNQAGDLVWEAETADTALQLPGTLRLMTGAEYAWYVDAMGADGEPVTSGPMSFTAR